MEYKNKIYIIYINTYNNDIIIYINSTNIYGIPAIYWMLFIQSLITNHGLCLQGDGCELVFSVMDITTKTLNGTVVA